MIPDEQGPRPLLELDDVSRTYASGAEEIRALDHVSLAVREGEFVAIMGQSGSGKSTLMNILGCLDRPTSGEYRVRGQPVGDLDPDALAALRRDTFGFIFQRYNLLATATAAENVQIPAIYAGTPGSERATRAEALLNRLGLSDRSGHRPSELSGGQQQRVAIARALMNDPAVILADEPTGALDSQSGEEVLALLKDLNAEGRTILLITHDEHVAAHADRIIQILDGQIVSDTGDQRGAVADTDFSRAERDYGSTGAALAEAVITAARSLRANIFRTVLTLLGIIIGVAAVITMLAIGEGSKDELLARIGVGQDTLLVLPGAPGMRGRGINTLMMEDAHAIADLDNVAAVVPERSGRLTVRYGNIDQSANVQAVGAAFPLARGWGADSGQFFTDRDIRAFAPVAVIGATVADSLFEGDDAIGRYILVANIPLEVIGIMDARGASMAGFDQDNVVMTPISTGLSRLFGGQNVDSVTVKVTDLDRIYGTQDQIRELVLNRHGIEDFNVVNMSSILDMVTEAQNTMTLLLAAVAAISLLVGGIGVMNIMLVSVTERTREIGIRMATGARTRDIMLQFNIEAAVVCAVGGVVGIVVGFGVGIALRRYGMPVVFTPGPAVLAFGCAFATGVIFGYLPARKAARLDPVIALASE
ncbi:MAG: MacB family efflux pump subunit [Sphingomonadales bacterium]